LGAICLQTGGLPGAKRHPVQTLSDGSKKESLAHRRDFNEKNWPLRGSPGVIAEKGWPAIPTVLRRGIAECGRKNSLAEKKAEKSRRS